MNQKYVNWFVLYIAYILYYFPRKADSVVKSVLVESELEFELEEIALSDTVYLTFYTLSMFLSGLLVARCSPNIVLCGGLWCIAGVSYFKSGAQSPNEYIIYQSLHACFQATGWTTCITMLATWDNKTRGVAMGLWTTSQSVGGIIGTVLATLAIGHGNWQSAYLFHVPLLLGWGIVCLFTLRSVAEYEPSEVSHRLGATNYGAEHSKLRDQFSEGRKNDPLNVEVTNFMDSPFQELREQQVATVAVQENTGSHLIQHGNDIVKDSGVSPTFTDAILLPGVLFVAASYFFLNFLRYALLMWLPYYFHDSLGYDVDLAGYVSTSFEVGGLFGTPLIGWLSDRVFAGKRDVSAGVFLVAAAVLLGICSTPLMLLGWQFNVILMVLVGVSIIGPDSILSATIGQEIGNRSPMGGKVVGILTGFIDGVGCFGSVFQSYTTVRITQNYGWNALFILFVCCASVSALLLFYVSYIAELRKDRSIGGPFPSKLRHHCTFRGSRRIGLLGMTLGAACVWYMSVASL